jgi:capsular polysaccharide biosynthesis protein
VRRASAVPVVGAFTVAGCIVGAVVGLVQAPDYRATTTVLVEAHGAPATVPTVAALAVSDTVLGNVADAVRADADTIRRRLHAQVVPGTALVRLEYDDADRLRAVQVAQQEATVLEAVVASRLGAATRASIADPARATRLGRPVGRDALLGGAIGLVLGLAVAAVSRRRPAVLEVPAPRAESQAAEPAVAEAPSPVAPEPVPAASAEAPRPGRVAQLRALVAEHGAEFSADQLAEWNGYLDALAAQEVDGELPPNLAGLAEDVFAPLLARP